MSKLTDTFNPKKRIEEHLTKLLTKSNAYGNITGEMARLPMKG